VTIPPHTPTADILSCTYGEPDGVDEDGPLNRTKVGWAYTALLAYVPCVTIGPGKLLVEGLDDEWLNGEGEGLISDLMSDLLHLATFTGCDPERILHRARRDFEAEAGLGYDQ
jgi:hypothetical protein